MREDLGSAEVNSRLLEGRVAVVAGASQGIGRAIAVAFARQGAHVVAGARNAHNLAETAGQHSGIVAHICDVTKAADVEGLMTVATERFGELHILCNCAGVMPSAKLTEITEDEWDATMATNVKGTFLGCKYAIPLIARAGGGSVINIGSANCYAGEHEHTAYVTSKGAQLLLTKNAAAEYAPERVRVNIICPGAVATPLLDEYIVAMGGLDEANKEFAKYQPLGGLIPAEAVADAAVFLASEQSKWITGASILIDAGLLASWDHPLVED